MAFSRVRVKETNNQIEARILFALRKTVTQALSRSLKPIKRKVGQIVSRNLSQSPTTVSLLSGQLRLDFGLNEGVVRPALLGLFSLIERKIDISFRERSNGSRYALIIRLEDITLPEIRSIVYGSYYSDGFYGGQVNWLEWLLTRGTQVVVEGFEVAYEQSPFSRTGNAVMRLGGDGFRVDPQFAGTLDDNFITRTIQASVREISEVVREEIRKEL